MVNRTQLVVSLDDPAAVEADLTGAKAANLAVARQAGLPTLPGMVLTTVGASALFSTVDPPPDVETALRHAWLTVSDHGRRSLVVRSSSTVEDAHSSSMAGQFASLLDVDGWSEVLAAVRTVLDSATNPELSDAPMAVLIQPFVAAARGGVLFGADPITGNADHLVVASVDGGPHHLVGGTVDGGTTTLTRRGRHVAGEPLERGTRRRLAGLAGRTEKLLGHPQDMEWAIDDDGELWLLQSRPITTPVHRPTGPRFGPGPVAETFPRPLAPLEVDLWVDPLRDGLREALNLSARVSSRRLRRSPLVVAPGGNAAADLDLLQPPRRRGLLRVLDPRPPARRLRAAWRVGRLRAALPLLVRDRIDDVDGDLLDVPPLHELSDRQLLGVLAAARDTLVSLHGYEVLAGLLLGDETEGVTGSAVALQALAEGRAAGLDDTAIVERDPVVLSLVPPKIGPLPALPEVPSVVGAPPAQADPDSAAVYRETLRVRARWVQELGAAAAWELAGRLTEADRLSERELVRWLSLDELVDMLCCAPAPADLSSRPTTEEPEPLPAAFHLATDGEVVADMAEAGTTTGAGGGRKQGPVHVGAEPAPGSVLVVRTLDPSLAPVLPGLAGLVSETGSPLSHLAILAREHGVPTVVGMAGALNQFRPGDMVDVDGAAGTVTISQTATAGANGSNGSNGSDGVALPGPRTADASGGNHHGASDESSSDRSASATARTGGNR